MTIIDKFRGQYGFLSNFYPAKVEYKEIYYPTVEHAFQAAKTIKKSERLKISQATTPVNAKRLGRGVTLRADWENIKYNVMFNLVLEKFTYHPHLRAQLLETGDTLLVEGNTWGDRTWGVCGGKGQNWLGMILMEIRRIYQQGGV